MLGASPLQTKFFGIPTTLDDLTMVACVSGGLYFWLARGKKFGELGLASVSSVAFSFIAMGLNSILLNWEMVDPNMLAKGYKIVLLSLVFDSGSYFYYNKSLTDRTDD